MKRAGRPWVIVLAGGSGERLRSVTTSTSGQSVPKQFCRLNGQVSMLSVTLTRARRVTPANRIVVLVLEGHRCWWERELGGIPRDNILVQSSNRGTAIGLLRALLHINDRDPGARVVLLPCDHAVDDEKILAETIRDGLDEVERFTGKVILLGAAATTPDASLGWIMPGSGTGPTRAVSGFVEKPSLEEAVRCVRQGALCNTLILAASMRALLKMYTAAMPEWVEGVEDGTTRMRERASAGACPDGPVMDFSRHVLQPSVPSLRVLPLPECGWTDMGTVERLEAWWRRNPDAWEQVRRSGVVPPPAMAREKVEALA